MVTISISWKALIASLTAVVTVTILTVLTLPITYAQAPAPAAASDKQPLYLSDHRYDLPATLITAAQIESHKQKMLADKNPDVPINMVKIGGDSEKHQAGISVVYRLKGVGQPSYAIHDDVAEVYHVLEGAGTMLLGGKLKDGRRRPTSAGNGMGISGTESDGAKQIRISKGDVLIIPAGTPHRFMMADEFTSYTVVRIDPDGVAPLLVP
jgi:mannose-6-phosphate isomerase-like protein (cupin superfamily)